MPKHSLLHFLLTIFIFSTALLFTQPVQATTYNWGMKVDNIPPETPTSPISLTITSNDAPSNRDFLIILWGPGPLSLPGIWYQARFQLPPTRGSVSQTILKISPTSPKTWVPGDYKFSIMLCPLGTSGILCYYNSTLPPPLEKEITFKIPEIPAKTLQPNCRVSIKTDKDSDFITLEDDVIVKSDNINKAVTSYEVYIDNNDKGAFLSEKFQSGINIGKFPVNKNTGYILTLKNTWYTSSNNIECPPVKFFVYSRTDDPEKRSTPIPSPIPSGGRGCNPTDGTDDANGAGIRTAIGCVPTEPVELIKSLVGFAIRIGGGIALLLMIAGAFQLITSGGNPDNLKKANEQITNAAIGLLFIIFAIMLLRVIGADILGIDQFINK